MPTLSAAQVRQLGEAAKVDASTVRAWLAGRPIDAPTAEKLRRLAFVIFNFRREQQALALEA